MLALVLADLEDRHDPRMVEVGRRLGLGVEALDVGVVGELAGEDHLERDGPVEAHLPGLEDDTHAAAGELADDLVVAEVADAGGFGRAGCGRWILPEHRGGGLIVGRSGLVAGRHGGLLVDRGGRRAWHGDVGGGPGAMVGASAIVEGFGAVWGSGSRGRAGLGARDRLLRRAQLALQGLQFGPQCGSALVGDVDQIVLDARSAPLPPVGLEAPADLIDAAGQVDVQAVEVVAGSVAHLDSVLGPRSIGCSPPEIGLPRPNDEDSLRGRCPFRVRL